MAGIGSLAAQTPDTLPTPAELKKMSLEELMDVNVTVVSKHSERLAEVASSVQVITHDDIKRFGAFTLPEALRLATNLQVAQVDASRWAISARGQNNILSNKLLVMIDGRSIYTPLYAGVFWDVQNMALDNIERIEVISGPGGTLWGANAVNGVINIVTKGAEFSQGGLVGGAVGTAMKDVAAARYGGKLGKDAYYRVWGRWMDHNSTELVGGGDGGDPWYMLQGGFQMDWLPKAGERLMVAGNLYTSDLDRELADPTQANGQNVMVRWSLDFTEASGIQVQAYSDRSVRDIPATFREDLKIHDFDFQHRLALGSRNSLLWGAGYRLMLDEVKNSDSLAFLNVADPYRVSSDSLAFQSGNKTLQLFSGFFQDEIALVKDHLKLTLGSKVEHNDYTGYEWMPSGRLAFNPDYRQTIWGSISRAVRSPSRFDADLYIPGPPPDSLRLVGGPGIKAENLLAYEAGYRVLPARNLTLSVSFFYDWYDDLRILEYVGGKNFAFTNGKKGEVKGLEFTAGYQALDWWQLRGGYTFLREAFWDKPGHAEYPQPGSQGNDPAHQFLIQSMMDLPMGFQLNETVRYVAALPHPVIPYYSTFDLGAAWNWEMLTLTVVGHDLAEKNHREFQSDKQQNQVPRSFSGRVGLRF